MSCLEVNVTLRPTIKVLSMVKNAMLKALASANERIRPVVYRLGHSPVIDVSNIGQIKARCGVVCSLVEVKPYINVSPDVIWLIPSNNFSQDVVVYSNVTWVIE